MAEVVPPYAMQNAGATHTAENDRMHLSGLFANQLSAGSMVSRGGISPTAGAALIVTQTGSPSMAVTVGTGQAYIPGTEGSTQGVYSCTNNAIKNVSITAAHASLPRIDIIVAQVRDSAYSGANNDWLITAITGTAASSPVAPSAPVNSLILAQISVGATVTSIVNANITDTRRFLATAGGVIPVATIAGAATATATKGQLFYDISTDTVWRWNGTVLNRVTPYRTTQTLGGTAASVTFSNIPTDITNLNVAYTIRGTDTGFQATGHYMRVNNDSGANNYRFQQYQVSAATTSGSAVDDTKATIGLTNTATAAAGLFSNGTIDFQGWNSPHSGSLGFVFNTVTVALTGTTNNNKWAFTGGGIFVPAGPYTSLTFFPQVGLWAAGTSYTLTGS